MPQRNIPFSIAAKNRFATVDGLLQLGGMLGALYVLVLLISHGGAG